MLRPRNSNPIRLIAVDLGRAKVQIPVAEMKGEDSGKTLLITAGVDGDEYAGIEAGYKIIDEFKKRQFKGRLIVIPILNIPGFENISSVNPLDNQFPKNIFPGKINGSPSERLIYWLNEKYIRRADVWLDLHGGAMTEMLDPYLYTFETGNEKINKIVKSVIKKIEAPKVIFARCHYWLKTELLAKQNAAYILAEAGYSGERNVVWINKHLDWIRTVMSVLGMINTVSIPNHKLRVYRKLLTYQTRHTGLWYPAIAKDSFIAKNQKIGEIYSIDGRLLQQIKSNIDGELLWARESLFCARGEKIVQIASEAVDL